MIKSNPTPLLTPEHWNQLSHDEFALLMIQDKNNLALFSETLQDEKVLIALVLTLIESYPEHATTITEEIFDRMQDPLKSRRCYQLLQKEEILRHPKISCLLIKVFHVNTLLSDSTQIEPVVNFLKMLHPYLQSKDKENLLDQFEAMFALDEHKETLSSIAQNKQMAWLFLTYAFEAPLVDDLSSSALLKALVNGSGQTGFIDHLSVIRKSNNAHIKGKVMCSRIENWYQNHHRLFRLSPVPNYELPLNEHSMLSSELPLLKPTVQSHHTWKNWFSATNHPAAKRMVHPEPDDALLNLNAIKKPDSAFSRRLWTNSAVLPEAPSKETSARKSNVEPNKPF